MRAPSGRGLRAAVGEPAYIEHKFISIKEKLAFYSRILPHPTSSGAPSRREPQDRSNPPINPNLHFTECLQDGKAHLAAFFGVELAAHDVVAGDGGGELTAVLGGGDHS